jgi:hypothetical protein
MAAPSEVDTITNRQAIMAFVQRKRSTGDWASAYSAAYMLVGLTEGVDNRLPGPYLNAVRDLCRQMCDDGLLTFSAHGYLGIAGQPARSFWCAGRVGWSRWSRSSRRC